MDQTAISHDARVGTAQALAAVGISHAWLVPPVQSSQGRVVIAAIQPDLHHMSDMYDASEQMTCLEWVLQEVHKVPVTVRLYFSAAAVPPSAVPIFTPSQLQAHASAAGVFALH